MKKILFPLYLILIIHICNSCAAPKSLSKILYRSNYVTTYYSLQVPPHYLVDYIQGDSYCCLLLHYTSNKMSLSDPMIFVSNAGNTGVECDRCLLRDKIKFSFGDSIYAKRFEEEPAPLYYRFMATNASNDTLYLNWHPNNGRTVQELMKPYTEFRIIDTLIRPQFDTIVLAGQQDGLFWKDVYINGKINVGYINIPYKQLKKFDKFLNHINELPSVFRPDSTQWKNINNTFYYRAKGFSKERFIK